MVFVIYWHESAVDLHVFPITIPPPISLSTRSLWFFPVHQVPALVSCIQPGLVICFTLQKGFKVEDWVLLRPENKLSVLTLGVIPSHLHAWYAWEAMTLWGIPGRWEFWILPMESWVCSGAHSVVLWPKNHKGALLLLWPPLLHLALDDAEDGRGSCTVVAGKAATCSHNLLWQKEPTDIRNWPPPDRLLQNLFKSALYWWDLIPIWGDKKWSFGLCNLCSLGRHIGRVGNEYGGLIYHI